jgi:hypothetical protein
VIAGKYEIELRAWAIASCAVIWSTPGKAVELELGCERLDAAQAEELTARAHLLLRVLGSEEEPSRIAVACDAEDSWVEWREPSGTRELPIDEADGVLEGALDVLESRVRIQIERRDRAEAEASSAEARQPPAAATTSTEASTDSCSRTRAPAADPPPSAGTAGGSGLAVSAEPVPSSAWLSVRGSTWATAWRFHRFRKRGIQSLTGSNNGTMAIGTELGLCWEPHSRRSTRSELRPARAGGGRPAPAPAADKRIRASRFWRVRSRMRLDSVAPDRSIPSAIGAARARLSIRRVDAAASSNGDHRNDASGGRPRRMSSADHVPDEPTMGAAALGRAKSSHVPAATSTAPTAVQEVGRSSKNSHPQAAASTIWT